MYEYETSKTLARLEYLAKFSLSDDCEVIDIPEKKECLKTDELECVSSDSSVCVISENKDSPMYVDSRCIDVVFCAMCCVLVVVGVIRSSPGGVLCWLRSRVTQRIRDGTIFDCVLNK